MSRLFDDSLDYLTILTADKDEEEEEEEEEEE